jgi:ferredoxin-NADP reductase
MVVGGGVGVTPCIALLREVYRVDMTKEKRAEEARHTVTKNVYFVWSCTNVMVYEWFRDVIERSLAKSERTGYPKLHLYIYATRDKTPPTPLISGRPDLDAVFDDAQDATMGAPVATFVCGPDQMVADVHTQCTERTAAGPTRFYAHSEVFNF